MKGMAFEETCEGVELVTQGEADMAASVGRILIADDDEDFRLVLVRRASRMGLHVVEARNGAEAVRTLKEGGFDVLVVDLYMPELSGLEVAQQARAIDPKMQTIILTGSASLETAVEALRAGVYDYLTKPLESLASFELSLTRALEHHYLMVENARLFSEVQRLAVTDPLTGLFNRRKLDETLELELERSKRYSRPLSAIMVDLDLMKQVNDRLGHPAGDLVLKDVGQAIRSQVRKVDVVTRYGGDEFFVLLPESDFQEALAIARRIREGIRQVSAGDTPMSASTGVAKWKPDYNTPEAFLQAVDAALYQAKGQGGGRIVAVHPASGGLVQAD
jgi:diguanylate cyclase (GGDEF)-like protein